MINKIYVLILIFFSAFIICQEQYENIDLSRKNAISNAVEKVSPSVVGIHVTQLKRQRSRNLIDPFWGGFFPHTLSLIHI